MEPLIIFKPTGETRCPKKGEWYKNSEGHFRQGWDMNFDYPIYERIEITIPSGAREMIPYFKINNLRTVLDNTQVVRLSRPKIKRWIWWNFLGVDTSLSTKVTTDKLLTESEAHKLPDIYGNDWRKVEGSEVECD